VRKRYKGLNYRLRNDVRERVKIVLGWRRL
jgi:hypothetical protein